MNTALEKSETISPPFDPWASMWLHPLATLRQVIERDSEASILQLAVVSGISVMFFKFTHSPWATELSLFQTILFCFGGGALLGLFSLFFMSWLLAVIGRRYGGTATTHQMRIARAWSEMPHTIMFILFALQLIAIRDALIRHDWEIIKHSSPFIQLFLSGSTLLQSIIHLWALGLELMAISVAHSISLFSAIYVYFLTWTMVIGAGLILFVFLALVSS